MHNYLPAYKQALSAEIYKDWYTSAPFFIMDEVARRLILNTYKTLLTRGQKGCFVYCEDEALREYFKRMATATDG